MVYDELYLLFIIIYKNSHKPYCVFPEIQFLHFDQNNSFLKKHEWFVYSCHRESYSFFLKKIKRGNWNKWHMT